MKVVGAAEGMKGGGGGFAYFETIRTAFIVITFLYIFKRFY